MAFDIEAALNGLAELVRTIPAMESVTIGAPESLSARISAWVNQGDLDEEVNTPVQGIYELPIFLVVYFAYAVEGSESAAEAQLADWTSELGMRLIQNRLGPVTGNAVTVAVNLNGSVHKMGLMRRTEGTSGYSIFAGVEARTWACAVRITQRFNPLAA